MNQNINYINIIAIIPARGGSKGIPGKNIKNFEGKPLISHSIEYAQESTLITEIYVSTDDEQIAHISKTAGAKIIKRPPELATDTASTESAIGHALNNIDNLPDIIVLLQPTSPLRPKKSLDMAINKFINGQYDSLLSLSPSNNFFWKINSEEISAEYDFLHRKRRQDVQDSEKKYFENGSVYIFSREHFESTNNRLGGRIGHVVFPEEYGYEIDVPKDLIILEHLSREIIK
tara:strand:- start:499 stop:1194 length:696 start_codon:yes stop_codon:yes gene_type:complete